MLNLQRNIESGGEMKSCIKFLLLSIVMVLGMVGCQDDPVKIEQNIVNNLIEVNLEELYQNNIEADSLTLILSGDNVDFTQTFTPLEGLMNVELVFPAEFGIYLTLEANLYYDELSKTAYSKYWIDEENNATAVGKLRASYYHQNVILKLDTNLAESVEVSDFYNYNALDHFFKEYQIENVEAIADEYCNTPMNFLMEHGVLWDMLDENMIPVYEYPFGSYHNPVLTCNNAFGCYDQYIKTNNEEYLDWFYLNVEWIINYKDSDSYLRYEFENTHETATLPIGWTSAMAQGEALALMSIAYHNSGDNRYLQAADEFFTTMHTNVGTIWNLYIDEEDYLWFEEYPSEDFCHVLNGKLFAMWGLWEYYCITRNSDALRLLQGSIASVLDHYPLWDMDGQDGSRYCKHTNILSDYHWIHLAQFMEYRNMFNISEFEIAHDTFTNQRNN